MQVLPCRYCGAPTVMKRVGYKVYQLLNEDGSGHKCREGERAKAIPVIFLNELDTACAPLTPEQVLKELKLLNTYLVNGGRIPVIHAAIEVLKLVIRTERG